MAQGRFTYASASLNANGDTTVVTPGTNERVYVYFVGVDVTVVGTTSSTQFKAGTSGTVVGHFITTALGHQGENFATGIKDYPGFALPQGEALVVTKAGGAAATERVSVIYEVK